MGRNMAIQGRADLYASDAWQALAVALRLTPLHARQLCTWYTSNQLRMAEWDMRAIHDRALQKSS